MRKCEFILNILGCAFFFFLYLEDHDLVFIMNGIILTTFFVSYLYYGIRMAYLMSFIASITAFLYSFYDYEAQGPKLFLAFASLLGWLLQIIFGDCFFSNNPIDGPYGVGYKEVRTRLRGNMVGIYYPMDKGEYIEKITTD